MKSFLFLLLVIFMCLHAGAQYRVVARVNNFKNDKGLCRACIFNNASSFKGESAPVQCVQVAVRNKQSEVVFTVPKGTYAISLFHDVNTNNKMDKNFLGIPSEGYGASLNKLPFASAPTFQDNKFAVGSDVRLEIRLRNL